MNEKRAICYCRVSTDEQASNYSLPTQLDACRKYAEKAGMVIVAEFSDDYSGATPLEARPEGRKAFTMLKSGEADCLIAYSMDRIARPPEDGDEWDTPLLIRSLARLGKQLHTVNRGPLKTDFASLLIAMLDAKSAGEERRKITERTSRGRNAKAEAGRVVGNGVPKYGYQFTYETVKGKPRVMGIEPKAFESDIVRKIFKWYCDDLLTGGVIAQHLTAEQIPTPRQDGKSKFSGIWQTRTVFGILADEIYAGVMNYGHDKIEIPVPALVSRETWEIAQQRRKENKQRTQRKYHWLLASRIACGCGYCMSGVTNRYGTGYYRCASYNISGVALRQCYERYVRADMIESLAWEFALQSKKSAAEFVAMLKEYQGQQKHDAAPLAEQIAEVKTLLDSTARKIKRIASLRSGATDDDEAEQYTADLDAAKAEKTSLESKLKKLEAEYNWTDALTDDDILTVVDMRGRDVKELQGADFDKRRRYLAKIDLRVIVKDRLVTITSKMPVPPRVVVLDGGVVVGSGSSVHAYRRSI